MLMSQAIAGSYPGEVYSYDTFGQNRLDIILEVIKAATGRTILDYFTQLKKHMNLDIKYEGRDAAHSVQGTCIDFSKLGQLILQKGAWQGEQLSQSILWWSWAQLRHTVATSPTTAMAI